MVQLQSKAFGTHLELLLDGEPLPGSATDPRMLVRTAGQILYVIAAINALVAALVVFFDVQALVALVGENGLGGFVMAVLYSVLGYFAMGGSVWAIGIATAIFALDGIAGLAMTVAAAGSPSIGGIFVRVLLVVHLVRAIPAARALRRRTHD